MVRQAMVEIMLGANLSLRQESVWVGAGSLAGGNEGGSPHKSEEWGWGQTFTDQDGLGDPPKCTLWCAIALGALLQGCPLDFVSPSLLGATAVAAAVVTAQNACRTKQIVGKWAK